MAAAAWWAEGTGRDAPEALGGADPNIGSSGPQPQLTARSPAEGEAAAVVVAVVVLAE
jgi:hypothetical protein